ncbi:hypothetical protein ACFOON_04485 [Novosphingobium piscinae]|uniref:Uncharacterized protein n=1 Tax=Novosphingobium piscinae TaxID=1507448 RepID=A0A7X1KRT3_9SPHN|nr:hypothetical protein [Novosphingobium piscinae]MBC2670935.1 hypothetical protein [Novosphingobium piscinae]
MNARAEPERWRTDPALFAPAQPGFTRPGTPEGQQPDLPEQRRSKAERAPPARD